jgi:hypothetical protein
VIRAVVVIALLAGAALADDDTKAKAVALFDEGLKEMKAGNFERACQALRESDRIHPDSGTRGSLARCYEKQGRVASAWKLWTDLSTTAPERLRPDAAANAKKLEPRLPKYVIRTKMKIAATIDGEAVDPTAGIPRPIDPGKYTFEANAEGYQGWKQAFEAVEGKTQEIVIAFEPVTPAVVHTEPIATSKSNKRMYGVILMGVGGAFVVGGTVLGVIARGRYDDAKDICGGNIDSCDPLRVEDAQAKVDSARSAGTLSTASFIVGGLSVAAGVYLFVTAPKKSNRDVAIMPAVGADGAGVIVRGGF